MAQASFQVTVEIRQLDGEEVLRDPITINEKIDVDLHKAVGYRLAAAGGTKTVNPIETSGVQAAQMVVIYSPDDEIDIDLTAAPVATGNLALFVNLEGNDLGLGDIVITNNDATLTRDVQYQVSGDA